VVRQAKTGCTDLGNDWAYRPSRLDWSPSKGSRKQEAVVSIHPHLSWDCGDVFHNRGQSLNCVLSSDLALVHLPFCDLEAVEEAQRLVNVRGHAPFHMVMRILEP